MWDNLLPPLPQFLKNHNSPRIIFEPLVATEGGWVFLYIPIPVPRPSVTTLYMSVFHGDVHNL